MKLSKLKQREMINQEIEKMNSDNQQYLFDWTARDFFFHGMIDFTAEERGGYSEWEVAYPVDSFYALCTGLNLTYEQENEPFFASISQLITNHKTLSTKQAWRMAYMLESYAKQNKPVLNLGNNNE